jgi:hypothetical protein
MTPAARPAKKPEIFSPLFKTNVSDNADTAKTENTPIIVTMSLSFIDPPSSVRRRLTTLPSL